MQPRGFGRYLDICVTILKGRGGGTVFQRMDVVVSINARGMGLLVVTNCAPACGSAEAEKGVCKCERVPGLGETEGKERVCGYLEGAVEREVMRVGTEGIRVTVRSVSRACLWVGWRKMRGCGGLAQDVA